jgi:hypothetical protein
MTASDHALVVDLLRDCGFPDWLCGADVELDALRAHGEVQYAWFIQMLEQGLPWPLPDRLVEVEMTVADLVRFRDVIAQSASDVR